MLASLLFVKRILAASHSNLPSCWKFHFVWLDGTPTQMEEIAYERREGDQIAEEQFFYDPAQRTPKMSCNSFRWSRSAVD